jgi:uncharacterized membrane protein
MKENALYNFFDDDDFLKISNKIKEIEKKTSGEIRIRIKEKRTFSERNKTLKELAEKEFFRSGIDKTKDKTGILFFLILKDRTFYILADEGINEKVGEHTWDSIKEKMQQLFSSGDFTKGIITGIEESQKVLEEYFPAKRDDKNELSNRVIIG